MSVPPKPTDFRVRLKVIALLKGVANGFMQWSEVKTRGANQNGMFGGNHAVQNCRKVGGHLQNAVETNGTSGEPGAKPPREFFSSAT